MSRWKPRSRPRRLALARSQVSVVRADSCVISAAGHGHCFDEEEVAAARRLDQPDGDAERAGAVSDVRAGRVRRAERLDDGVRRDLDRTCVAGRGSLAGTICRPIPTNGKRLPWRVWLSRRSAPASDQWLQRAAPRRQVAGVQPE